MFINSTKFEFHLPEFTTIQMIINVLAIIVSIFALFFYGTVISLLAYYKQDFSNSYFIFVKALGICDLIILILSLHQSLTFTFAVAKEKILLYIVHLLFMIALFSNALLHFLIACNRFAAIVLFLEYKLIFTNKRSYILIGLIVSLCVIYTILYQVFYLPYLGEAGGCILGITAVAMIVLYTVAITTAVKRIRESTVPNINFNKEVKLLAQAVLGIAILFLMTLAALANLFENTTASLFAYLFAVIDMILIPLSYVLSSTPLRMHFKALVSRLIFKPSISVAPQNIPMAAVTNQNTLPPVS